MKSIITDKWILCPECKAKTRTQVLENTELKNFPLFCPKCKEESLIDAEKFIVKEARRKFYYQCKRSYSGI